MQGTSDKSMSEVPCTTPGLRCSQCSRLRKMTVFELPYRPVKNDRFWEVETADPSSCSDRRFFNVFVFPKLVASFAWWRGFCSAPWRSCCRDHAGLAAGWCRGLNREGCARSGPFGSLPLRQSPKAPPLTRITMPRPMRTMGKRMCSQRSSTSAIGGRVATNFARATRTATSARKTMQ